MGYLGDGRLGLNFGRNGRFDSDFFGKWERPPMGYLGDGRLGLNFGRFGRIDPKYFGRWEIDLVKEQINGRNRKIHWSTYSGAGRLAVIKVGDREIETPHRGPLISLYFFITL